MRSFTRSWPFCGFFSKVSYRHCYQCSLMRECEIPWKYVMVARNDSKNSILIIPFISVWFIPLLTHHVHNMHIYIIWDPMKNCNYKIIIVLVAYHNLCLVPWFFVSYLICSHEGHTEERITPTNWIQIQQNPFLTTWKKICKTKYRSALHLLFSNIHYHVAQTFGRYCEFYRFSSVVSGEKS